MVDQLEKRQAILNAQFSSVRLDGLKEGREKGHEEVAKNLFLRGFGLDEIQSLTGVSIDALLRIQQSVN